jgi:peptidylprolyl isomerase
MFRPLLALVAAFSVLLLACGDGADDDAGSANGGCTTGDGISRATFNNEKATTTGSGLMFCDEVEGSGGSPLRTSSVTVHYTGYLADDGTEFDSSRDGNPATFGMSGVIPGFSEALSTMKPGGRRLVLIPSDLGYGAQGFAPVIPPNADLIFDLELISFR